MPDESADSPQLPDVPSLMATCVNLFAAKAWEAMGLVPSPETKQIERNLEHAQLAIDSAAAIAELLKPRLADAERRDVDTLLANLRLNFVEQKAKG